MLYLECFTHTLGEPIVAEGEVFRGGEVNINMSSIYTKLIQEAGRLCDLYASDLLVECDSIERDLNNFTSKSRLIGFRENGVDHTDWILCRRPHELSSNYRSIWKLGIEFADDDYYESKIKVTLQRVGYSEAQHERKELEKEDK